MLLDLLKLFLVHVLIDSHVEHPEIHISLQRNLFNLLGGLVIVEELDPLLQLLLNWDAVCAQESVRWPSCILVAASG